MALHRSSGRWQLGLSLALATVLLWATLPVALKIALEATDPWTLTWFRFLVAALVMGAWMGLRGRLRGFAALTRGDWILLAVAALMLIGNYVLYLLGLHATTPANAQLIIQLAPLLMALGGVIVFRERFTAGQWLGLAVLCAGLLLFFRDQLLLAVADPARYLMGSGLIVLAAIVWAVYALAQKQLLTRLSSQSVLVCIYVAAAVLLLPTAAPRTLLAIDAFHWAALVYCALNTVAAYGAFAEALAHWEASRVSVVLALTPLSTMAVVALVHALWPDAIAPERIGWTGYAGALLVVSGSAAASLLGTRRRARVAPGSVATAAAEERP